jgi:hypothetical protein
MKDTRRLSEAIQNLYKIADQLSEEYSEYPCRFLLDGNLLGSIGEVYAAERYNLELFNAVHAKHDARTLDGTNRLVQIKVTQCRAVKKVVALRSEPQYLLVLQVDDAGEFREVYNGPGDIVWDHAYAPDKPTPSSGQWPITLSVLERLDQDVAEKDRI